ncbi:unnamed protein product [Umbelopsis vinacea]
MAIILAAYHPQIQLLGISTTHGNQTLDKTTINCARVVKAAGIKTKIVPGQRFPLVKPSMVAADIHGISGLDGTDLLPEPDEDIILRNEKAVLHMAQVLRDHPTKVTIVAVGPYTNVALLLTLFPELKQKIEKISLMGGGIAGGNRTPVAEFNVLVDPEACHIIFESGLPVYMVPLDVTHKAAVTDQVLERIEKRCIPGSNFAKLIIDLLVFFKHTYENVYHLYQGPPLHDPCAVAILIAPEAFTIRHLRVDVVTDNGLALGQTICDIYQKSLLPPNVHVATDIDHAAFFDIMLDAWVAADQQSPLNNP